MSFDAARDCPQCPSCSLPLGTPIEEAQVERWDGAADANLYCPSCGTGWTGSPGDLARALISWRYYEETECK